MNATDDRSNVTTALSRWYANHASIRRLWAVEDSLAFVKTLTRKQIEGTEDKEIVWTAGPNTRRMKGAAYLQHFALPNFFFFVTTAYDILRHRGVPIGKRDFLGPVNMG